MIPLKTHKWTNMMTFDLLVALDGKSGDLQSNLNLSSGNRECLYNMHIFYDNFTTQMLKVWLLKVLNSVQP